MDENSYLIKIGKKLADLFKTKTKPAAITTMHVITPRPCSTSRSRSTS